jgi:hypothetical protein
MRHPLLALVYAAVAFLTAAPLPAAPLPDAAKETLYFPTKVGAKWVVEGTFGGRIHQFIQTVTKVESKNGTRIVTTEIVEGESRQVVLSTQVIEVSNGELFVRPPASGQNGCSGKVLKQGKEGDRWEIDLARSDYPDAKVTRTLGKTEDVTVPAGRYKAVRVETEGKTGKFTVNSTTWYAPGVGIVKEVVRTNNGLNQTNVLKSFSPGE